MRLSSKPNSVITLIYNHVISYPTPVNLNYFWNFGSLATVFLAIQLISGIFLAMHFTSNIDGAFMSVEHIMRDVMNGWFIRYVHSNGASMFFIIIYMHIARGLYYKSFKYESRIVWFSGLLIFVLMMATAFIGYVLPWGQMSYWGATVITNMFSAVPLVGTSFVHWLWGGFSVGAATLSRFFSFHYALPFVIVFLVVIHIAELHASGSSNPFAYEHHQFFMQKIFFYPYFIVKDLLGLVVFFIFYSIFIFFIPNFLGHSDNYIEANPLVTPAHIIPEWYFLPFYAILRSIPSKIGGIIAMFGAILIFFTLPHISEFILSGGFYFFDKLKSVLKSNYYYIYKNKIEKITLSLVYFFFLILGWLGSMPVTAPFTFIGLVYSFLYFLLILSYVIAAI